jgi:hypothetical protein
VRRFFFSQAISRSQETDSMDGRIIGSPLMSTAKSTTGLVRARILVLIGVVESTDLHSDTGTWACGMRRVAAKQSHTGAKLGATKGHHMFSYQKQVSRYIVSVGAGVNST